MVRPEEGRLVTMTGLGGKGLGEYRAYLAQKEKSIATIDKYLRDVRTFMQWLGGGQDIMETIGATGIRISELRYITVTAVQSGKAEVSCKGKKRQVYLVRELRDKLLKYCRRKGIRKGSVFVSRYGNPLDRSNIWSQMKAVGAAAGVCPEKVFPHNLRHLFARVFWEKWKDLFYLADILGHSNVNTTRIYTMTTVLNHAKRLRVLGLVT